MPPAGKPFVELNFPPRTYDIDFAGVVNNIVYIRWLEDLRLALMAAIYPVDRALREDAAPILLSTNIEYVKPVTIQDQALVGRMWVPKMERIRWHVAAEFSVGDAARALRRMSSFMALALEEAERAAARSEVPVGAVLVDGASGVVLAADGNRTAELGDPTAHAEMLVLRAGAVSKSRARLDDCDLYVTLEPCAMCAAAISLAHVR